MKITRTLCLFGLLAATLAGNASVEISNRAGTVIEVDILQIESTRTQIKLSDGQVIWLDRSQLSDASDAMLQARVEQAQAEKAEQAQEAFNELNTLLGIPLFADRSLWDDDAAAVAERLGWPLESMTESQSSYRVYPRSSDEILQSRPYSAVLFAASGKPDALSLVFANKGDFPFSASPTRDEIRAMEAAIDADGERIARLLSEQLGEPTRQQFGRGRGIRQSVQRWDWESHAILLATQRSEYVTLRILPIDVADDGGRGERLSDAALRNRNQANIETKENGDVLIRNIPMVNQGPKGYCVPATFERYLRYMNIPADMYVLAMAGQTQIGGGTSLEDIISAIEGYASSQNRSLRRLRTDIRMRTISRHIDNGLPLIWTMFSSRDYNEFVNQRTIDRRNNSDWNAWADRTRQETRQISLRKDMMSAHACMIIGYNATTGEIAVSDSWGPSFELRWVPVEHADQVSQGSIYLIDY